MITQERTELQALSPQTWDKPTALAKVGDYIHERFQPRMVVVDKDILPDGRIWLLVKPESADYTQEWILDSEPEQLQQSRLEKKESHQLAEPITDSASQQPGATNLSKFVKPCFGDVGGEVEVIDVEGLTNLDRFLLGVAIICGSIHSRFAPLPWLVKMVAMVKGVKETG